MRWLAHWGDDGGGRGGGGSCSESPRRHCSVWIQVLMNPFVASEQIGRGCWKELLHVNVFRSEWDAAWYCSIRAVSNWASDLNHKMSGGRWRCIISRQDTCSFKSQCCSLQRMAPVKNDSRSCTLSFCLFECTTSFQHVSATSKAL